jgi:cyclin B
MASTAQTRLRINSVPVQNDPPGIGKPIVKKRTAVPTTRAAFGILDNRQVTKNALLKQPIQRAKSTSTAIPRKTSSSIRQPLASNVNSKPISTINSKFNLTNKKESTIPKPKSVPVVTTHILETECEEKMIIGSPEKQPAEMTGNVFEVSKKLTVGDIDIGDVNNPQLCSEFVNDIYHYMLHLESCYKINPRYLSETGLKSKMRTILVDWLIQVHHRFELLQETLYLTIIILDRFLQSSTVPRAKLQLAGVTAMLIASKYEEMYAPEVTDFEYITDKAFTAKQILSMEVLMLKTLDFNLGCPLPWHFLRRNSKAGQVDAEQHTLAKYVMELSLIDYEMCHVSPSKLAAAALCLSINVLGQHQWNETLEHYSRYSKSSLVAVVTYLAKNLYRASCNTNSYQQAIVTKYSSAKFMRIAKRKELKSPLVQKLAEESQEQVL